MEDRDMAVETIKQINKPVVAYKILAAGRSAGQGGVRVRLQAACGEGRHLHRHLSQGQGRHAGRGRDAGPAAVAGGGNVGDVAGNDGWRQVYCGTAFVASPPYLT